jgi:hypothetical protein
LKSAIFYDLDDVSTDDVVRARAKAAGAQEFMSRGSIWPNAYAANCPHELPGSREFGYQQQLMDWVDRLFAALGETHAGHNGFDHQGISLFEVARFRFFLEIAAVEHRSRVLSEIVRDGAERIVWVAPPNSMDALTHFAAGAPIGITLCPVSKATSRRNRFYQAARSTARRAIERITDLAYLLAKPPEISRDSARPIVFAEFFPNSAKVLIPVANELRERHQIDVVWLALRQPVHQLLRRFGIESVALQRLSPAAHWDRAALRTADRRRLQQALNEVPDDLYRGTGELPAKSYLRPAIERQFMATFDEAAHWIAVMCEAFDRLRPRCVVSTTYSNIVGRATACAARRAGSRSIYMQHGMFPDCDFFASFTNDLLLLWGEANRRTMLRNGIPDSQIQVVGATIYDDLIHRAEPRNHQHADGDNTVRIAYLASRTGGLAVNASQAKRCCAVVAEAAARVSNSELTVKVHPGDKTGMLEAMAPKFPGLVLVKDGSSEDVIRQCDIAIVVSSTTGLEACIAGKPLIVLKVAGAPDYGPYEDYGAAAYVQLDDEHAADALAETIRKLTGDSSRAIDLEAGRHRLIDDLLNAGTGDATSRAATAIAKFSDHQQPSAATPRGGLIAAE